MFRAETKFCQPVFARWKADESCTCGYITNCKVSQYKNFSKTNINFLLHSHVSGVTVLSIPADIYKYGSNYAMIFFGIPITCLIAAVITMPVFHKLQITSTYEYLQLRFDTKTRLIASFLYNIAMILYLPIVIYGPALALSQGELNSVT